ncbi:hypothetical protein AYO46_09730 [Betaproteobacteria bacterium SCGC AG-212-J23]|nr:hypothetical protein AYO46_09730 [Betaproteobacteria bacterium SCGC AG-212-J23]
MRLAIAAALCLAAGCSGPGVIKAYPGGDRGADEIGTVVTTSRDDTYTITDNRITSVDEVRYEKGGYTAQVLPGPHRFGVQGTVRAGRPQLRTQYCTFEVNVESGCAYQPAIPAYPRSALEQKADVEWHLTRPMTVVAECSDTSYALQVLIDCTSRP